MSESNFIKCSSCGDWDWRGSHKCAPLFRCVNRKEWFGHKDKREISELTQAEFDEIEWCRGIHARDAQDAAEKYLDMKCHNGDGLIDEMEVYVKDGASNITRHSVVAELVCEVHQIKQTAIKMPECDLSPAPETPQETEQQEEHDVSNV